MQSVEPFPPSLMRRFFSETSHGRIWNFLLFFLLPFGDREAPELLLSLEMSEWAGMWVVPPQLSGLLTNRLPVLLTAES